MRRAALGLVVALTLGAVGCGDGVVFAPVAGLTTRSLPRARDQIDLLFVVDDSPGSSAVRHEALAGLHSLLTLVQGNALPYSFHFGVITPDLGANDFVDDLGQCHPGGDGARLLHLGKEAAASCQGVVGGANFIAFDPAANNLPSGQDLATTFDCMAAVGDKGCGYEQPLEAAYRALRDPPAENAGFLRDDAILVVAWISQEDDCSASPQSDLFDAAQTAPPPEGLGPINSFRCTKFSIACGSPPQLVPYDATSAPLVDCHDATSAQGNKLYPVQRYVELFTRPRAQGGLKDDPRDVVLWNLSAPATPFETAVVQLENSGQSCPSAATPGCGVILQPSCHAANDPARFGDPAVRLRQVVAAASTGRSHSLCADAYAPAIDDLSNQALRKLVGGCVELPLADAADPHCEVSDVTTAQGGSDSVLPIPRCDRNGGGMPCWQAETSPLCPAVCQRSGDAPQQLRIVVRRAAPVASNTATDVQCQVIDPRPDNDGKLPTCDSTP